MKLVPMARSAVLIGLCATSAAPQSGTPLAEIAPDAAISAHLVEDLDGDGRAEILLLTTDGRVEVWRLAQSPTPEFQRTSPSLSLPRPGSSLLAIADVVPEAEGRELLVADARGVVAHSYRAEEGTFAAESVALTPARLGFATGVPRVAELAQDLDQDGWVDLAIPARGGYEIWLQRTAGSFDLAQTLPLDLDHDRDIRGALLSDELRNDIEVPRLDVADVNGDGRPDLRTEENTVRKFWLQGTDGRFAETPIEVDLALFRDTTPAAEIALGDTLVIDSIADMQQGDLDDDGIPDYVIAHRRKVWSFLSSRDGPQFTKSRTRRVARDISGLLLVDVDGDRRDDLLVFVVALPSAAELLLGLVSSIEIEIEALGYPTDTDGAFARRAGWQRTLTLRMPSLRELLGQADDLIQRFLATLEKLRFAARGDFDGDGSLDLALTTENGDAIEIWLGVATQDGRPAFGEWLRGLLFENSDTVFDIDRLLHLVGQVIDLRNASLTDRREADARFELAERPGRAILDLLATDLDGDGRDELLLIDQDEQAQGDRSIAAFTFDTTR